MTRNELARYIDHTALRPETTDEGIITLCTEAHVNGFASVCVMPYYVPLAARIRRQLEDEPGGALPEDPFIDLLEDTLEADQAKRMLEVAIEWGRYGELYEYDYHTGRLKLPGTGNTKE